MFLKYLIIFASTILCVSSNMSDIEVMYLNFFTQIDSLKKSVDLLKFRVDVLSEKNQISYSSPPIDSKFSSQVLENLDAVKKSLYELNNKPDKPKNKYDDLEMEINILKLQQELNITTLDDKYSAMLEELNTLKISEESLKKENADLNAKYLKILKDNEATKNIVKQSEESLKQKNTKLEEKFEELLRNTTNIYEIAMQNSKLITQLQEKNYNMKPLFDVSVDKLPEYKSNCIEDPNPVDCQTATKCTQKSGYYKINIPGNKTEQIMVYCDMETYGGGWLHIIRRMDGSENFTRNWTDYVNGFGKAEGEYFIGLNNLHALTNNNGRQLLYIYIENFEGESRYALYDNFSVGNAAELYELRSVGSYNGTAADKMTYNVGQKFTTIDVDNDYGDGNCALHHKTGGWWYKDCTFVLPTGLYLKGKSQKMGVQWHGFGEKYYSHKLMYFMIRKF